MRRQHSRGPHSEGHTVSAFWSWVTGSPVWRGGAAVGVTVHAAGTFVPGLLGPSVLAGVKSEGRYWCIGVSYQKWWNVVAEEKIADTVVSEVARIFKRDPAELSRDTRFAEDLGAKSMNVAQLIAVLEDDFGIAIPFMEARRRKTVGEAIDFVTELCRR